MAMGSGMDVASIRPGTIRKPPPIPKKPENRPTANPMPSSQGRSTGALRLVRRTSGSPSPRRRRSIRPPTASITNPNRASRLCPSTALAAAEPARAPRTPASENAPAHRHFTFPARHCGTRLPAALTETARALVPMATWGEFTPTA
ncbi:hypothetical protein CHKEEEPN_2306 [Methylorubrum podarium]|nr:hypothetical protein CHKEEEPN_2306 [Methylorubrum podarium]